MGPADGKPVGNTEGSEVGAAFGVEDGVVDGAWVVTLVTQIPSSSHVPSKLEFPSHTS